MPTRETPTRSLCLQRSRSLQRHPNERRASLSFRRWRPTSSFRAAGSRSEFRRGPAWRGPCRHQRAFSLGANKYLNRCSPPGRRDARARVMTLDPKTKREHELRGGTPPWRKGDKRPLRAPVRENFRCEALVVGAGITGSLIAQHLASVGVNVAVIDREVPGLASTAASTSMLQWEFNCSLVELTELLRFERAAAVYRLSLGAVSGLCGLVRALRLRCALRNRKSLYLAGAGAGGNRSRFMINPSKSLRARACGRLGPLKI